MNGLPGYDDWKTSPSEDDVVEIRSWSARMSCQVCDRVEETTVRLWSNSALTWTCGHCGAECVSAGGRDDDDGDEAYDRAVDRGEI
jgi:RNase P subunit RPR2